MVDWVVNITLLVTAVLLGNEHSIFPVGLKYSINDYISGSPCCLKGGSAINKHVIDITLTGRRVFFLNTEYA
jgi:hypothetical protein